MRVLGTSAGEVTSEVAEPLGVVSTNPGNLRKGFWIKEKTSYRSGKLTAGT